MSRQLLAACCSLLAVAPALAQPTADQLSPLHFRSVGPFRGGRVTAVTGVPQRPHEFYMGATGGGVWKTTDAGHTWRNISDGAFATPSIGAVRVAPSNPDIVWVGTGSDGIRSNIITGRGIYRSSDAGRTWSFRGLRDVGQIGAVEIHPTNPDIVLVAAIGQAFNRSTERGVYRTTDGGATWQKVLFINDSTGVTDLEFKPDDPNTIYAAAWRAQRTPWTIISGSRDDGGIYRSTDGGSTWTKLGGGLPTGLIGKADLAVSRARPQVVYALIEAPRPRGGLYRSEDGGTTWAQVSNLAPLLNRPFYYTNVDADPRNADVVYVNNETFFRSTDGGRTFAPLGTPHGDNHDLWINPDNSEIMIQSNDGGANVTMDGGRSWSTQYNQPTAELYQVTVDNATPYRLYGAQQDNTTVIVPSLPWFANRPDDPIQYWMQGPGCETGPIIASPWNDNVVYGACKGQFSRLHRVTGQETKSWVGGQFMYGHDPKDLIDRFQRVAPLTVSPHTRGVIYHTSQFVYRSRDEGTTWERISPDLTANDPATQGVSGQPITRDITGEEFYSTIYAFAESPLEQGVLWAGANDGPVHVSRDNGRSWQRVTPPALPAGARIQSVEPSRHARGTAYIAAYRYMLGDWQPYAFRTTDYGHTWTRITTGSNGVPADVPTRVLREDAERPNLLYLGTEFGLYVSLDGGAHWQPFQNDLPVTPITDIKVHRRDLVLSTMGRGFWVMDDLSPLVQLAGGMPARATHLFTPRPAVRWRHDASPASPTTPEYPAASATIDYWLGSAPSGPLSLEIVTGAGAVLRRFTGGTDDARTATEQGMRAPRTTRTPATTLTARMGLNRFQWDLMHEGPRGGGRGPIVAPGRYTARLIAGRDTLTQPLVVQADPRVREDGLTDALLVAQEQHDLRVRDAVSAARALLVRAKDVRTQVQGRGAPMVREAESIVRELETAEGRYQQPMLVAQLEYLASMTAGVDQRVPADAIKRLQVLRAQLEALTRRLDALGRSVAMR